MGRMLTEYAYNWAWSENSRISGTIAFPTTALNVKAHLNLYPAGRALIAQYSKY